MNTPSQATVSSLSCGVALEMRIKADAVYDAHSHRSLDELEEQLYEHLDAEFPGESLALIRDVVEAVLEANGHV